ncbi:MAG: hypothetical protein ACRDTT_23810, partial [Pseudonocardiaceae bacterium]
MSSAESGWPHSAQARLAAIHGVPLRASERAQADPTKLLAPDPANVDPADVDPADVDRADANPAGGPPEDAAPRPREGRLVRWWVPAPLR